ncbi:MAG: hypothetical protein JJU48_09010 [Methylophaga sp.]|nr:hypothetical protein [Methylophaga sp.]
MKKRTALQLLHLSDLQLYRWVLLLSIVLASLSFFYNVWRMEVSEHNAMVRTAGIQILQELAELEQIIFIAHYDQDLQQGSPRRAWVRVGLIDDLSVLMSAPTIDSVNVLRDLWQREWPQLKNSHESVISLGDQIDEVRLQVKSELSRLK